MKWTNNFLQAKIGDTRRIRKFAWWPKPMGALGVCIWFEHYVSYQVFKEWKVPGPGYKGTRTVRGWKEIEAWYR